MTQRLWVLAIACVCASVDVVHKANARAEFHHARSAYAALGMGLFVVALVVLVPRFPSRAAQVGAGVAAGGALGNLISVLAWSQGVPDPLVWQGSTHGVAFNLADVFALAGDALLLSAVAVHSLRHRDDLRAPV